MNFLRPLAILAVALLIISGGLLILLSKNATHEATPTTESTTPVEDSQPAASAILEETAKSGQPPASQPESQPTSTIVQFSDQTSRQQFLNQNNLKSEALSQTAAGAFVVAKPASELSFPSGSSHFPNQTYVAVATPNDTHYPQQWHLPKISAPAGWDITTGSTSVTVGVIDSGFALGHEDLSSKWATNSGENGATGSEGAAPNCTSRSLVLDKNCNNLDDDGNGKTDDWRGWDFVCNNNSPATVDGDCDNNASGNGVAHGSLTAGAAAAATNNSVGTAGVDWQAKILPIQALGDTGSGSTDDVAEAIDYATSRGVQVISLSLGAGQADSFIRQRIDAAVAAGIIVVAAAGNCGDPNTYILNGCNSIGQILEPAMYTPVIAVGASDQNDNRAAFSSYGDSLDLIAPGSGIVTTSWSSPTPTSTYGSASGTSLSTPLVSGTLTLLKARMPDVTSQDLIRYLINGLDKIPSMGSQNKTAQHGYGRVNLHQALLFASGDTFAERLVDSVGMHFYTNVASERDLATSRVGYHVETPHGFNVAATQTAGTVPVYRLVHGGKKDHFFTISTQERNTAQNPVGYQLEGIAFFVYPSQLPGTIPVFRLVNPHSWDHFYTISESEKNIAKNIGYIDEGTAFFVLP